MSIEMRSWETIKAAACVHMNGGKMYPKVGVLQHLATLFAKAYGLHNTKEQLHIFRGSRTRFHTF